MKKLSLLLSLVLMAGIGLAVAQEPAAPAAPAAPATEQEPAAEAKAPEAKVAEAKPATHDVTAEFVAVDAEKKTLSIKLESGETASAPAEGKVLAQAKKFKAGDKVVVTCKDKADGSHEAAIAIKAAAAAKKY